MYKYRRKVMALAMLVILLTGAGLTACQKEETLIDAQGIRYGQYGSAMFKGSVIVENDLTVTDSLNVDGDIDYDGDGFDVDTTGAISLDADTASNFNTAGAGIDLTIESEAGRVVIKGDEAAADGVYIDADDAAGTGLDIDVGATNGVSIDGGMLDVGTGTCGVADGDNDVCIAAVLEVDGEFELDGALDADSTADFAGLVTFSRGSNNAATVSAGGTFSLPATADLHAFGYVAVGDGTPDGSVSAGTDETLYVEGAFEVDGEAEFDGAIDSDGGASFAGASTYTQVNGAGASANPWDYTGTTGIMDGSDNMTVIDINVTSANHTSTSNVVAGIDLSIASQDADAEESAIIFSANWDNDLNAVTSLDLSVDDAVIVVIADPPAANANGDILDVTVTNAGGDGTDYFILFDLNVTGSAGTDTTNTTTGIDLSLTSPQASQIETAILLDTDWDVGIDMDASCLDLDLDADTSICADTEDTIDIEINAADDFQFTANTFTLVAGSRIAAADETTGTHGVMFTAFGTHTHADVETVASVLSIPANANVVDVMYLITTDWDDGATATVDCGIEGGDTDAFLDAVDLNAVGNGLFHRMGGAAEMPALTSLVDVGASEVDVVCQVAEGNNDAANGSATLYIMYILD